MAPRRTSTGTGRKKIEIRRIESEAARHVCFSKRRKGLFNKMSELATLCDAEVAAVAFSPGGKAFTFGHPSADSVFDHFLSSNSPEALAAVAVDGGAGDHDQNQALAELNREHGLNGELRAHLEAYKVRKETAVETFTKARAEGCQAVAWLQTEVSQMGEADLVAFEAAVAKLGADAAVRTDQVLQEALLFGRPVHGGGEFELGGTSASGGMAMTQRHQMMMMLEMPPPTGLAAGTEMTQQQMMAMPPPAEFDAGTEMVQQQQQMMMMAIPPTGEMMQQEQQMMKMPQQEQQQMMMMEMPPPLLPTGLDAVTEMMQQQQMMMAMPPPPLLPGFAAGMETVHQGFGPQGFPQ